MKPFVPDVRNAVRAVIIRSDKVLLLEKHYKNDVRYALPGGGQDVGETLSAALQRECREEIGTDVIINGLAYVAEFFKARESEPPTMRHLVEFLFACEVPENYRAANGTKPDKHQKDVVWASLDELKKIPSFPQQIELPFRQFDSTFYQGLLNGRP